MMLLTKPVENASLSTIICVCIVIVYFFLIYIKNQIFKEKNSKKASIINFLINIVFLLSATLFILYFGGYIDFKKPLKEIFEAIADETNNIIKCAFTIFISVTVYNTLKIIINKTSKLGKEYEKRRRTLSKVIMSFIRYFVYIIDGIIILAIWGINVRPMLAGLGIASVVIGLGAQKLIGDFISGIFIIFERHFDVGDIVDIGGCQGEDNDIGLKTTKIKSWKNEVKIIANGNITEVINYSLNNSIAVVEFSIAYKEDVALVTDLVNNNLPSRMENNEYVLTSPKVSGVSGLDDSGVRMLVTATTVSECQYGVERQLRQEIKKILDENNIEIPFPQMVVTFSDKKEEKQ